MIIATAGHVDHGKTLLVKALTGIDADRLPEEKRRGMTIDLGFAYLPMESAEPVGFIDVPGHERFIHNMLCGVAGIDFVLFIVAADDGPMPQTREHLAILDLLAVRHGAVALTKVDRVAPSRVSDVQAAIATLLMGTALENMPVFPVSATTGKGILELQHHLIRAARDCPVRPASGNFRLAIDRCFSIVGAGLVVTGTAVSGSVAVGDHVRVLQAGISSRVRAIHAHNTPSGTGRAGQRCALNLSGAGLKDEAIRRGDWVVTGDVPGAQPKIDAQLRILKSEQQPFAHWTPVHVHMGATDVTGRVAILEGSAIAPGSAALVQLVLDRPVGTLRGDGFVIRDQSAQRTVGGGMVLDIFPPVRGRARQERLAFLNRMKSDDDQAALQGLLDDAPHGVNLSAFAANRNLTSQEAKRLFANSSIKLVTTSAGLVGFSGAHWDKLKALALGTLAVSHRRATSTLGLSEDRILGDSGARVPREVALAVAAELLREEAIIREAVGVRLPSHMPKLDGTDAILWSKVVRLLGQSPLHPPAVHEIAAAIAEDPKKTGAFLLRAARIGLVNRVSENRFFLPAALRELRKTTEALATESKDHRVTAAALRDRTKIGRTVAIEVLEYFDRIRFTRRVGDTREVVRPAEHRRPI